MQEVDLLLRVRLSHLCDGVQSRGVSIKSGCAAVLQVIKYALIVLHADDNGQGAPLSPHRQA